MLELAKSSGAFTVAITSDPESPLARVADARIVNATPTLFPQPDDLFAKHAQLLVLDLLYLLVAQHDYAATADEAHARRDWRSRPTGGPSPTIGREVAS